MDKQVRRQSIFVRHNAEIAHRLSQLPGKCQQIHGHSLQIELSLFGEPNEKGILGDDFGTIKKSFRSYIDTTYDHHLLMNADDPLLKYTGHKSIDVYPGLILFGGDPTIENIAMEIGVWAHQAYLLPVRVRVNETNTNGAEYES